VDERKQDLNALHFYDRLGRIFNFVGALELNWLSDFMKTTANNTQIFSLQMYFLMKNPTKYFLSIWEELAFP